MTNDIINKELVNKIESLLKNAREKVVREVNNTLLITYMEIGRVIVEDEKLHIDDSNYETKSLRYLSKELTNKFGNGFSLANLHFMIAFYNNYGSVQTLSKHLGWSHYCELLSILDKDKRSFYEKECSNARWSIREPRRQIESSLYERILLSNGKTNKEKVLELALKGNEINTPEDIIKDPYVFEFLGLPENKPLIESDLEESLIKQIEKFILELGKNPTINFKLLRQCSNDFVKEIIGV